MKRLSWFFVFAFMAYACQLQNGDEAMLSASKNLADAGAVYNADVCGEIMEFDLLAGASQLLVGTVAVSNDEDFLYVEFFAQSPNTFGFTHLEITCEVPEVRGSPGQYSFNGYLAESSSTYRKYVVPKADLPDCDCFYIRAHAEVGTETAFGGIFVDPTGGSWFNYISYCWQECYEASGFVFRNDCDVETPYAGVTVTLVQGSDTYTAVTNANGYYLFEKLGPTTYTISVPGATPPSIENQYTTENNNFVVYFYEISGRVTYDDCGNVDAYPGVTVTLKMGEEEVASTTTNTDGWYFFKELANGTYTVWVEGTEPVQVIIDGECFFDIHLVVVNENCWCYEPKGETAWAFGPRYVSKGSWAMYTPFVANSTVTLFAGQTFEAGTVHFSENVDGYVTLTFTLNDEWSLKEFTDAIHIEGYDGLPPAKNPAPGQFTTYKGNMLEVTVPFFAYYGIHLDLVTMVQVPCPEE
jgi:hypothetical protein